MRLLPHFPNYDNTAMNAGNIAQTPEAVNVKRIVVMLVEVMWGNVRLAEPSVPKNGHFKTRTWLWEERVFGQADHHPALATGTSSDLRAPGSPAGCSLI
jgi:hypothetical protein